MVDSNLVSNLRHIFKLDPNRSITEEQVIKLTYTSTDAIIVGGTLEVTYEDTFDILKKIKKGKRIPIIQEISNLEAIVPGFDYYFIPLVLNAQDPKWILNIHHHALKKYGEIIEWKNVLVEGYVVLNQESSVAKLTKSKTELDLEDLIAYSIMCDKMLNLPILYIEYSGVYGNPGWMEELSRIVNNSRIFYGGGITNKEKAIEMSKYANTIIVGNLIYEDFDKALETTIINN